MDMPLYPHESRTRRTRALAGLWDFRLDPDDRGERLGWHAGFAATHAAAVPASWNELFDDCAGYFGTAWYQTSFHAEPGWRGQRTWLRIGAASYRAKAWLNGELLGEHSGGHLPFVFEIGALLREDQANRLVVMVDNALRSDRLPAAAVPGVTAAIGSEPAITCDFFPCGGIHRPVQVFTTPAAYVRDIGVRTSLAGGEGRVAVEVEVAGARAGIAHLELRDGEHGIARARLQIGDGRGAGELAVPAARAWCPADPHLYELVVTLGDEELLDEYRLPIGIRTIAVAGDELLLNGEPLFLRGFGKHEDVPGHGRGLDLPALVREFELLRWIGANSIRTTHYPCAEEALQLADRLGILVIAETPGVSLPFTDAPDDIDARETALAAALDELIARDRNHPSVILWSIANEPGVAEAASINRRPEAIARGTACLAGLFARARELDPTRPLVLAGFGHGPDAWVGLGDIVCANLYYGWYYGGFGRLDEAAAALDAELQRLRAVHGKPVMLTEFGAEALAGWHAQPPAPWSEEYQAELIAMTIRVARAYPWVIGTHPWAFADFRTAAGITRAGGLNHKGVFTRERGPKLAAHRLRALWRGDHDG